MRSTSMRGIPCVGPILMVFGVLAASALVTGCGSNRTVPDAATLDADQILQRMTRTYRSASSYEDQAVVHLQYRQDGRDYEDESPVSICWQAPNRIRLQVYQVEAVCDGQQFMARLRDEATRDFDGQVVRRPAPERLTLRDLWDEDEILSLAFRQGLTGYPLQLDLLLSPTPLAALMQEGARHTLLTPAALEGSTCFRVQVTNDDGPFVLWIDQQSYVLHRVEYPAAAFAPDVAADRSVQDLQLRIEFRMARLGKQPSADAFAFRAPPEAKYVKRFIAPPRELPSNLFGKTAAPYTFATLRGETVSHETLQDRIKVLVWFNNHPACQSTVQQLNRVYLQYQTQARLALYAVCTEPSSVSNEQIESLCQAWQVDVPVLRDLEALGRDLFQVPWAPTMVVLDGRNVVQIVEVGANPNLVAELPQVLEQLLSGEDVAGAILDQFRQEQADYEAALARGEPDAIAASSQGAVASQTMPKLLQLRPLWKNDQLQATGNIFALEESSGRTRFLVFEGWRTLTEIDAQGEVIARHQLDLPPMAAASQLQTAVDGKGQRYYAVWSLRSPHVWVFDAQWHRVLSYPDVSVQHDGVQDAVLADLDGDALLELHVGFWGDQGVHCATLNGRKLWHCQEISHVLSLMTSAAADERLDLWASSAGGQVIRLDHHGRSEPLGGNSGQLVHHLFTSLENLNLENQNSSIPYCGITYGPEGRRLAIGLSRDDQSQWRYNLPAGAFDSQIRFVTSAPLLDDQQCQWLIAGTDGSVHIISQDGRFTDFFQSGKTLVGLAGGRLASAGVIVLSSRDGLAAFEVSPIATARK